ncbi:hypothetical protein [Streptomyces sp. 5-6(2022)]|uniref:hypothetical protein n=1 Tax=Streptomyces sp. 5-6(2022) TaxID=2936510 RepID=UPI0023B8BEFA|nr:hypothetical protein [Streptomyces sp. 5-6(2022)]
MNIDLSKAIGTAEELLAELKKLDGTELDEAPTRAAKRQHTKLNRTLLRLSHLGNRASVEIMDTYHDFKRRDDPAEESDKE